ncbi:MAG: hypothetical protein E7001_05800 [Coriobacteriaceae bacterium]|nr:hypothetical protein [Coriobacteriaceae bacterium]
MPISSGLPQGFNAHAYDAIVVGASFAGSVCARRLAEALGYRVAVLEERPHVAGNAGDYLDLQGQSRADCLLRARTPRVSGFFARFADQLDPTEDDPQDFPSSACASIFAAMLDHDLIDVICDVDARGLISFDETHVLIGGELYGGEVVYTGPLDVLFDCDLGRLSYPAPGHVPEAAPGAADADRATIDPASGDLYERYLERIEEVTNFHLAGRVAEYRTYDMDAAVEAALELSDELIACHS